MYTSLSLPEEIQSPFHRELLKGSGLPFCNLHLSSKQRSSLIHHTPLQAGSITVLPKELICGYKVCEGKLFMLQGDEIYIHKTRGAAEFGNGLQPCVKQWPPRSTKGGRSKRRCKLSTPSLTSVRAVTYCGANWKNIFALKPRCREERAEPAAVLSKKQEWVSVQHKCFGERREVTPE